jgi:hypothetical protein
MSNPTRTTALAFGLVSMLASGFGSAADDDVIADLTGTWEGLQVCDNNTGGEQINFVTDDQVEITQDGSRIRLRRVAKDGTRALIYEGSLARIDGAAHVEALVSICDGTYVAQEMLRLRRVLTKEEGSGTFDAESLFESTDAPGLEEIEIFGTCKWAYERVSIEDPNLPACRR